MGSAFGAGAGADALQEILKQKFAEQFQRQAQAMEQQRMSQSAAYQDESIGLQRRSAERADEQAAMVRQEHDRANTERNTQAFNGAQMVTDPNTPKALRFALQYRNATGENAPNELLKSQEQPAEKPDTPIVRLNPRTGKVEQMGSAPAGAHFVNEPAPPSQGPTHGRFNVTQGADPTGKPVMIRTNVDTGEVSVLPMPDGVNFAKREQPATQDQTNLGLYANRLEQSDPLLKGLEHHIATMNPVSFKMQTAVDQPMLQSKEIQSYQQAARNFINSVLRRESGAAISEGEFDSARKQYLPTPGDTPETLAQKAQNRQVVLDNFKRGAGPAYRPIAGAQPAGDHGGAAAKPSAADLIKKYGG
jgi:hypothetical protein